MKINEKILSLPPYISTVWPNVKALWVEDGALFVLLSDGISVAIPGLSQEVITMAFEFHQKAMETKEQRSFREGVPKHQIEQSIRFGMNGMELGNAMQHSFELKDAPSLPQEILSKVEAVARVIAPDMKVDLPKAEPHCNCPHCQIARAIHRGLGDETEALPPYTQEALPPHEEDESEPVFAEELQFEQWQITQTGHQLYTVANKIDANEKYSVFLGNPVGCTCGKAGCEHILAVLRS